MSSRRVTVAVALLVVAALLITTRMLHESGERLDEESSAAVLAPRTAVEDRPHRPSDPLGRDDGEPDAPGEAMPLLGAAVGPSNGDRLAGERPGGDEDLEEASFVGRVVDDRGRAVGGADVLLLPDDTTGQRLGIGSILLELDVSKLPTTTTDSSGAFQLHTWRVHGGETKMGYSPGLEPILFVHAPGLALQAFPCTGYTGGTHEAGEIVMEIAVGSIVARVVTPWGKPIEGVRCEPFGGGPPLSKVRDQPGRMLQFIAVSNHLAYGQVYRGLFSQTSDAAGFVNLPGVWPGKCHVSFGHEEYENSSVKNVIVRAGEVTDLGSVVLRSGSTLRGRVLDAQRAPIEGATVYVRDAALGSPIPHPPSSDETERRRRARVSLEVRTLRSSGGLFGRPTRVISNANGVFVTSGLKVKRLNLYVDAPGFEPLRVERVPVGTKGLDLVLQRAATIRITVVDKETGSPLRTASVRAFRRSGLSNADGKPTRSELDVLPGNATPPAMHADAESAGTFLVSGVGPMGTDVLVTADGYETRGDRFTGVKPPASVSRTIELRRESSLAGRVMEEDGSAVQEATVTLTPPPVRGEALEPITARGDVDGRYSFRQLTGGDYRLSAVAEGLVHVDPIELHIAPGEEVSDQDLVLERASVITGTLVTPDGVPARGQQVTARRTRPSEGGRLSWWSVRVGGKGAFTFEGLKPGTYEVFSMPGVHLEFELGRAEVRELSLVLRRTPRVRGRVTAGGQPLGGASVHAEMVFSDANGKRQGLPLPVQTSDAAGSYRLQLDFEGEHVIHAQWKGGGKSRVERIFPTWDETVIVDLALGLGVLKGRVVERSSRRKPRGSQVRLLLDGTVVNKWQNPDRKGSFVFDHLVDAVYEVQAKGRKYALTSSGPVTVTAEEQADDILLTLSPGASIEGLVWSATGQPTRSRVYLVTGEPARLVLKTGTPKGAFQFRSLPPGTYRVVVADARYPDALQSPELHGNPVEQAAVDVVLGEGEVRHVELHL